MNEHRVVGPPGTGKTTYLKRQFERAAERYGVENVYACSLTRTAAAEIASRVERVPRNNIGTLHSHAYRLLKYPRIVETTEGLREWNEFCGNSAYKISGKHAANPENASAEPPTMDSQGAELMQQMGVLRQRMVSVQLWPASVRRFKQRWDEFKVHANRIDFTDLIEGALDSVDRIPGCHVLFVDEAQDMSKLEFALARKWGSRADELVIVGDPDQNLYEWRGSDPAAFYASEAVSEHVLSQSYRVPRDPHRVARTWIKQIRDRKDAAYDPTDHAGRCVRARYAWRDPAALIADVEEYLASDDDKTVMILAACGYMLNPITSALRDRGLPFHNPYRRSHGGWNPLAGSRRLLAFLRPDREVWGDDARMWTWQDLRAWSEVLQSDGTFRRGFKSKVEVQCTPRDRFDAKDGAGNEVCDVNWLFDMLADEKAKESVVNLDIGWWESRLRHNDRKSQQFSLTVARRHGAAQLLGQPRICVGTIHSVKGGESDRVYLFPDLSAAGFWSGWKTQGPGRDATVRQFYVGMTRCRDELVLCDASNPELAVRWPALG